MMRVFIRFAMENAMAFQDYPLDPTAVTTIGTSTFIGPNMARANVRPALQQLAADGKALFNYIEQREGVWQPATSATSVAIGTGSKSFTASTQRNWSVGQYLLIASTASPTNYMTGQITSYAPTTGALVVSVNVTAGSGTFAAWTLSVFSAFPNTVNGDFSIIGGGDLVISASGTGSNAFIYNDSGSLFFNVNGAVRGVMPSAGGMILGASASFDAVSSAAYQFKGSMALDTNTTASATAFSFFNGQGPSTRVGWIGTNGSATSYNTSSDRRLKDNIAPAESSGAVIDAIQIRQFDWKIDDAHVPFGVIAQELVEVAPEAVSIPNDPADMMGVDYSKLVPLLIAEVQSLRARVAVLEG